MREAWTLSDPGRLGSETGKGPRARARGRVRPRRRRDAGSQWRRRRPNDSPLAPAEQRPAASGSRGAQPARTAGVSSPSTSPPFLCAAEPGAGRLVMKSSTSSTRIARLPVRVGFGNRDAPSARRRPSGTSGDGEHDQITESDEGDHSGEQQVTDGTIRADESWLPTAVVCQQPAYSLCTHNELAGGSAPSTPRCGHGVPTRPSCGDRVPRAPDTLPPVAVTQPSGWPARSPSCCRYHCAHGCR